jgi:hypothetical protein
MQFYILRKEMSEEFYNSKERRILVAMRKTLASVIKDLTPSDSMTEYPLSDATVKDVKVCLELIAVREMELAKEAGVSTNARPHFIDEPAQAATNVVSLAGLRDKLNAEKKKDN